jgi:hypothetical protein
MTPDTRVRRFIRISDNLSTLRLKKMISNFQLDESGKLYYHVA